MKRIVAIIFVLVLFISLAVPGVAAAEVADVAPTSQPVDDAVAEPTEPPAPDAPNAPDETAPDAPDEAPELDAELAEAIVEQQAIEALPEAEMLPQAGEIGSERKFKIASSIFGAEETAVLAAKSQRAQVYVVKSDALSSYKDFYPDGVNENAKAKDIAQRFDQMYALISTPGSPNYFAQPYDINGDGSIIILLCDIANDGREAGGTPGGYVSGLFNTADFTSFNKAAMLYADVAPNQGYAKLKGDAEGFYQTIMHEYAHLLSFSCVHENRQAGKNSVIKHVFAEEAMAELAGYLYTNKFNSGKLGAFFTSQFKPRYGFLDWNYGVDIYANASFGAADMMGLAYYNNGGDINGFLSDPRGGSTDTFIAMGDHFTKTGSSSSLANFDKFFNSFALDTYVSDPAKIGPHIKNFSGDGWSMIDLYGQPVLAPGKSFAFSAYSAPYMPQYFVIPRMGERLSTDTNVVKMTLTDEDAKSRFYVVYPSEPFSSVKRATRREYKELVPGREVTIPVGQGNDFAVVAVNFVYDGTDASIMYETAKDTDYPFQDMSVPEVSGLKAEHDTVSVKVSWSAPQNLPAAMTLDSYEVYRDGVRLGSVNGGYKEPSYTDRYSNLEDGKSYEYTVKTVVKLVADSSKLTSTGVKKSFTLLAPTVGAPQEFKAAAAEDGKSIVLNWKKAEARFGELRQYEPNSYEIYRDDKLIHSPASYYETYTDSDVTPGKTYTYTMRSKYGGGSAPVYSAYTPRVSASVKVVGAVLTKSQFTYSLAAKAYTGSAQGVTVTPKSGVGSVTAVYYTGMDGTSYAKSKTKPKNIGTYKVTVTVAAGSQYLAGTVVLGKFKINPKKMATPRTEARAKRLYVYWTKASAAQNVTGYQVRYRRTGSSAWSTRTCRPSLSSTAFTALVWGESYQVQVRSYKKVGGVNYYGDWSGTANSGTIWF